jgi:hypothetical protein
VPGLDEDVATMSIEAARNALKRATIEPSLIRAKRLRSRRLELTNSAVPTSAGFWTSWLPFSFAQSKPFCWWVAVVVDHWSRRSWV